MRIDLLKRYIFVGLLAYGIEMLVVFLLQHVQGWSPVNVIAISFWVGTISAFLLQKLVAFRNLDRRPHIVLKQVAAYVALVGWNYLFTLALVNTFEAAVSVYIIRTISIAIVMVWNYFIYKVVFGAMKSAGTHELAE